MTILPVCWSDTEVKTTPFTEEVGICISEVAFLEGIIAVRGLPSLSKYFFYNNSPWSILRILLLYPSAYLITDTIESVAGYLESVSVALA